MTSTALPGTSGGKLTFASAYYDTTPGEALTIGAVPEPGSLRPSPSARLAWSARRRTVGSGLPGRLPEKRLVRPPLFTRSIPAFSFEGAGIFFAAPAISLSSVLHAQTIDQARPAPRLGRGGLADHPPAARRDEMPALKHLIETASAAISPRSNRFSRQFSGTPSPRASTPTNTASSVHRARAGRCRCPAGQQFLAPGQGLVEHPRAVRAAQRGRQLFASHPAEPLLARSSRTVFPTWFR